MVFKTKYPYALWTHLYAFLVTSEVVAFSSFEPFINYALCTIIKLYERLFVVARLFLITKICCTTLRACSSLPFKTRLRRRRHSFNSLLVAAGPRAAGESDGVGDVPSQRSTLASNVDWRAASRAHVRNLGGNRRHARLGCVSRAARRGQYQVYGLGSRV